MRASKRQRRSAAADAATSAIDKLSAVSGQPDLRTAEADEDCKHSSSTFKHSLLLEDIFLCISQSESSDRSRRYRCLACGHEFGGSVEQQKAHVLGASSDKYCVAACSNPHPLLRQKLLDEEMQYDIAPLKGNLNTMKDLKTVKPAAIDGCQRSEPQSLAVDLTATEAEVDGESNGVGKASGGVSGTNVSSSNTIAASCRGRVNSKTHGKAMFYRSAVIPLSERTMGVVHRDDEAIQPGYTLLCFDREVYLIDEDGRVVHEWTSER